jgi:DNA-nicking Smr family endonuclease
MSRRRLSDEERVLWKGVTRSISPLKKIERAEPDDAAPSMASTLPKLRSKPALPIAKAPVPNPTTPPPLALLGRKMKQRIARGRREIEGRLDLHGMTQAEAHDALFGFLRAKQARGAKVVLIITGKGARGGDDSGGRGVLKRMVPRWLEQPKCRDFIVGFEAASIGHGGEGALYVCLRKIR